MTINALIFLINVMVSMIAQEERMKLDVLYSAARLPSSSVPTAPSAYLSTIYAMDVATATTGQMSRIRVTREFVTPMNSDALLGSAFRKCGRVTMITTAQTVRTKDH